MSADKTVTSQFIKSVTKGRKTIAAEYATKTDTWDRTFLAKKCIRGLHKGSREGRGTGLCCQSYLGVGVVLIWQCLMTDFLNSQLS